MKFDCASLLSRGSRRNYAARGLCCGQASGRKDEGSHREQAASEQAGGRASKLVGSLVEWLACCVPLSGFGDHQSLIKGRAVQKLHVRLFFRMNFYSLSTSADSCLVSERELDPKVTYKNCRTSKFLWFAAKHNPSLHGL